MTYDFRRQASQALQKGDIVQVLMKHGSWWSEMRKGLVLEVQSIDGETIFLTFRGWPSGPKMYMKQVDAKGGKVRLQSDPEKSSFPRGLTVKIMSQADQDAQDKAMQERGARPW